MEQKNSQNEKLIFTQTWLDYYIISGTIFFGVLILAWHKITSDWVDSLIFIYCMAQIFIPSFLLFKFFAIRRFELDTNKIIITIGDSNEEIIIWKSNLKNIKVVKENILNFKGFGRTRIRFLFYYHDYARFDFRGVKNWLYGKSLKITHYLFSPQTHKVIEFLKTHYSDILDLDPAAESYALEEYLNREQQLNEEDNN